MDAVVMRTSSFATSDMSKVIQKSSSMDVIFDTGSSLILGPTAHVDSFAYYAGAKRGTYDGITCYVLDSCNVSNIPSLSFRIQGKEYVLSGSDLVIHVVRFTYYCSVNVFSWLLLYFSH